MKYTFFAIQNHEGKYEGGSPDIWMPRPSKRYSSRADADRALKKLAVPGAKAVLIEERELEHISVAEFPKHLPLVHEAAVYNPATRKYYVRSRGFSGKDAASASRFVTRMALEAASPGIPSDGTATVILFELAVMGNV